MDTKDLRAFLRVYEEKSVNKAAKQLFITPQGLSRVIHNLETDLGTTLFMRTPSGMLPTDSGVYLYENSRTLLQELDALETGIRRFQLLQQDGDRVFLWSVECVSAAEAGSV